MLDAWRGDGNATYADALFVGRPHTAISSDRRLGQFEVVHLGGWGPRAHGIVVPIRRRSPRIRADGGRETRPPAATRTPHDGHVRGHRQRPHGVVTVSGRGKHDGAGAPRVARDGTATCCQSDAPTESSGSRQRRRGDLASSPKAPSRDTRQMKPGVDTGAKLGRPVPLLALAPHRASGRTQRKPELVLALVAHRGFSLVVLGSGR